MEFYKMHFMFYGQMISAFNVENQTNKPSHPSSHGDLQKRWSTLQEPYRHPRNTPFTRFLPSHLQFHPKFLDRRKSKTHSSITNPQPPPTYPLSPQKPKILQKTTTKVQPKQQHPPARPHQHGIKVSPRKFKPAGPNSRLDKSAAISMAGRSPRSRKGYRVRAVGDFPKRKTAKRARSQRGGGRREGGAQIQE
ncbi:hypothetical protein KM043_006803 [Ampulex compressa]|nr:hypothetical protein KM043_006803 [Ampulex compressa]